MQLKPVLFNNQLYLCMCVCMGTFVCMFVCVRNLCMCSCIAYACVCVYTCVHMCACVRMCVYMNVCWGRRERPVLPSSPNDRKAGDVKQQADTPARDAVNYVHTDATHLLLAAGGLSHTWEGGNPEGLSSGP